jgi:cellulose biosynthesis protein BcsQ
MDENVNGSAVLGDNRQTNANPVYQARGSFKKLILTVWANPHFGCELAYLAAKNSEFSVMLIDLDLLSPTTDLLLNVPKYPENIRWDNKINNSSLDILMDSIDKNYLTSDIICEASVKRKELKNLYIVTGNYNLNNYEYYSDRNLVKLLDKSYQYFDITILLVNKSIYDSFTVISLLKSDYNIIPIRSDIDRLREFNSYVNFLKEKQHIPEGKNKFVIYGYDSNCLDRKLTNQVTGGSCIGSIRKSEKREKSRNLKTPYVRRIEKNILNEYIEILSYFNIVPKSTFFRKMKEHFKDIYRSLRALARVSKTRLKVRRSGNVSNN